MRVVECYLPAGKAVTDTYAVRIDPGMADWRYCSLRITELSPGGRHTFDTGDSEWIVLPLSGSCSVTADGQRLDLAGRTDVFTAVTDFAYVPRDARTVIASDQGGRFALAGARCDQRLALRYVSASAVPVELRGTGPSSRQVNNFGAVGVFDADRLIAVEVITPGGNWSSYPPHKHDEDRPGQESELEEIYYFEVAPRAGVGGVGYQRVTPSAPDRGPDVLAEVRTGDVVLVPAGWHGPSIATPGHDLYYLNVMAGPGDRRWSVSDHPDYAWVRPSWASQAVDARLPLYSAAPGGTR